MTGQLTGADVAALRALARSMQTAAGQLDSIRGNVRTRLHTSPWQGRDAQAFRSEWDGQRSKQLAVTCEGLRQMANELEHNARQQEQASGAGGSAHGGGGVRAFGQGRAEPDQMAELRSRVDSLSEVVGRLGLSVDLMKLVLAHPGAPYDDLLRAFDDLDDVAKASALGGGAGALSRLGKVLGPLGVALDAYSFGAAVGSGDTGAAFRSGVSLGFAVLAVTPLAPIGVVGGLAWTAGTMLYDKNPEFRSMWDDSGRAVGAWASSSLRAADQVADHVVDVAGDVAHDAIDAAAGSARRAVDGATSMLRNLF